MFKRSAVKSFFYKKLNGGDRTASFLFIFTFLILLIFPLNTSQSADIIWVPMYTEDFNTDIFTSPNLVQNPGFEDGLNYWDPFQNPGNGWSSSTDNPYSGSRCAKYSFPNGNGYYDASIMSSGYQVFVEAGVPYYFSFWIREKDTHDTYDTSKTIVDPGIVVNGTWYGVPPPSHSESWQLVTMTMIFPDSGYAVVHFELHGYAISDSAEFAVDDVVLKKDDWTRSDASVSVDTINGWLHIAADGVVDDRAQKSIHFSLPIREVARMRLESGGFNYRLPALAVLYGVLDGEGVGISYLPGDTYGWEFKGWTNIHTLAPESENVWRTVNAIIRADGGELWAKADSDTAFTLITTRSWSIPDSTIGIRFTQEWDAVCDLDYITVSFCDTLPDLYSLIFPDSVDSVKTTVSHKTITFTWQKSIDPDPNDTVWYDLYLSRSVVFHPDSTDTVIGLLDTTASIDFPDLSDLGLWYWKVKAYDKWGAIRWSDQTSSFYVYVCGDCNGDGQISVADVICEINFLFKGGSAPVPYKAGDVNCDGVETVSDVVYKINYLFKGGPKPCQNCP